MKKAIQTLLAAVTTEVQATLIANCERKLSIGEVTP